MEIKMFNMEFGESIFIRDYSEFLNSQKSEGLLVDCGSLIKSEKIDEMYDMIYDKVKTLNPDALITHFHTDHIAGFVKFAKEKPPIFNTLYLPDIFNIENRDVVFLVLLDFVLKNTNIFRKEKSLSLYDLAVGLCFSSKKISFLKKGDKFRIYEVLAPDINHVKKTAQKFNLPMSKQWGDIVDSFITLIQNKATGQINRDNENFLRLKDIDTNALTSNLISNNQEYHAVFLNELGHSVNIVFHTDCDKSWKNILFTGDADQRTMENLYDNNEFHKHYIVYKAPHHGTECHLFTGIKADKLLISNGQSNHSWTICRCYCCRYHKVYCTNCNCCDARDENIKKISKYIKNYCESKGNELVFPDKFCKFTF